MSKENTSGSAYVGHHSHAGGAYRNSSPIPSPATPVEQDFNEIEEAVLYLRVSTKKQMDTDADYDPEGNSIPTQRDHSTKKADALGAAVVKEYIEPGRSATSIDKRPAFQQMMRDLREFKRQGRPIKYVIVYMMSRAFRNLLEELTTKTQLQQMGITLVSAKENFGDGYLGDAMQGMMAILNELQSRSNGADTSAKMANKARNGGTVGRAPLGYLNAEDTTQGRKFRTVVIDPERGPLVKLAFELYATGDYTLADLSDELYDRGLRNRPRGGPAQQVSVKKLSQLLRDRYYIGVVTYRGEEYPGRHEPLISLDLFDRVQDIIESRAAAQEKRRVHNHYLKGSLKCGTCRRVGVTQRMIMQQTVNRTGNVYLYFFCRGRQNGTCDAPHIHVGRLEEAVERHYATIRFRPAFVNEMRAHLDETVGEEQLAATLLKQQLTAELKSLDDQEENLLDLAADGTLPQAKIKARLRKIEQRRASIGERLGRTNEDLSQAARLIEVCLKLLENPQELYLRCDDQQRRMLNQAIFHALYVEEDRIGSHDLKEPFDRLHALASVPSPVFGEQAQNDRRSLPQAGKGPTSLNSIEVLLGVNRLGTGSSKTSVAPATGLEPVTCRLTAGCSAD
ncbi:recombinase family protein [Nocardiopsis rhodophaea]